MMMNSEREVDVEVWRNAGAGGATHLQAHAQDLSARMARKSKPIPPPLNLSAMADGNGGAGVNADSQSSLHSPLKDFALLATSPRSPLVQKNLPFRKRAHSYSSTRTSSECESPESPLVPCSPIAREPTTPFALSAAISAPPPTPPLATPTATTLTTVHNNNPTPSTTTHHNHNHNHNYSHSHNLSHHNTPLIPSPTALTASPLPSPSPFLRSPLASPTALTSQLSRRFLNEPIKSLLPSPNTSASFFNNECDPVKSPSLVFYRPAPDLLPLSSILDKNSLKSPLQTPTRSVFLQNQVDSTLFFTDVDKLKSPLNTPFTIPTSSQDLFLMPEPVAVKSEPSESPTLKEKENVLLPSPPSSPKLTKLEIIEDDVLIKREPSSPEPEKSTVVTSTTTQQYQQMLTSPPQTIMSHYLDAKLLESYSQKLKKHFYMPHPHHPQPHGYSLYHAEPAPSAVESYHPPAAAAPPPPSAPSSQGNVHYTPEAKPPPLNSISSSCGVGGYRGPPQTYKKAVTKRASAAATADSSATVGTDDSAASAAKKAAKSSKEVDEERPRRPMNAFMLFAKHQRPLLIQQHPGKDNRAISVVLGAAWRELQPEERADYVRKAAAMALEHKRRHPDCWKRRRIRPSAATNNNSNHSQQSSNSTATSATISTTSNTTPS